MWLAPALHSTPLSLTHSLTAVTPSETVTVPPKELDSLNHSIPAGWSDNCDCKSWEGRGDPKNCYKYKKNRNKKELSFGENI
jgi:hypothetical protein